MLNSRPSRFSGSIRWRLLVGLWVMVAVVGETPYPIAAAPSFWLRQDDTATTSAPLTFVPDADAHVVAADPNANAGSMNYLLVDGGQDPEVASYLRFTVSGITAPIKSATLRLWVRENGVTQDGPDVRATNAEWTEKDLTWNTRPYPAGAALDDAGPLDPSTWAEYDVTAAVSGDGPIAFALVAHSSDGAVFVSREGEHPPQLVITLEDSSSAASPSSTPDTTRAGADPVLLAAGDIADCDSDGDEATAKLLDGLSGTVATLGDTVYESGTPQQFADCYDPSWGRDKNRTKPAAGNHDYLTKGASGYFGYFGAAAGDPAKGYYSYDLGSWHIVVLNSNCSQVSGCDPGSPQEKWLRQDLDTHPTKCTLAYWHHPRFNFGEHGNTSSVRPLWQALYEAGAEIVLSGHDHNYQRWTPQDANGAKNTTRGIREFVVGTGGKSHYALGGPPSNVEKFNDDTSGILRLTLHPGSYDWQFMPVAGKTFTDTGSTTCH
jgi:acid phosphatase type 7